MDKKIEALNIISVIFRLVLLYFETGSCYLVQPGLELVILLPLPVECWDYRCLWIGTPGSVLTAVFIDGFPDDLLVLESPTILSRAYIAPQTFCQKWNVFQTHRVGRPHEDLNVSNVFSSLSFSGVLVQNWLELCLFWVPWCFGLGFCFHITGFNCHPCWLYNYWNCLAGVKFSI